jgi:hypothetical protein
MTYESVVEKQCHLLVTDNFVLENYQTIIYLQDFAISFI